MRGERGLMYRTLGLRAGYIISQRKDREYIHSTQNTNVYYIQYTKTTQGQSTQHNATQVMSNRRNSSLSIFVLSSPVHSSTFLFFHLLALFLVLGKRRSLPGYSITHCPRNQLCAWLAPKSRMYRFGHFVGCAKAACTASPKESTKE